MKGQPSLGRDIVKPGHLQHVIEIMLSQVCTPALACCAHNSVSILLFRVVFPFARLVATGHNSDFREAVETVVVSDIMRNGRRSNRVNLMGILILH